MYPLTFRFVILTFVLTSSFNVFASDTKSLSRDKLMAKGKILFKICGSCHGLDGKGTPFFAPALTNSPIVNGPIYPLISTVIEGKELSKNNRWDAYMPAWSGVFSNDELASVITYTRNSLGNSVGDLVQLDNIKIAKFLYRAIRETRLPSGIKTCSLAIGHEKIRADYVTIIKVEEFEKHKLNNTDDKYNTVLNVIAKVNGICKYFDTPTTDEKEKKDDVSIKYKTFTSEFKFIVHQSGYDKWIVKEVI